MPNNIIDNQYTIGAALGAYVKMRPKPIPATIYKVINRIILTYISLTSLTLYLTYTNFTIFHLTLLPKDKMKTLKF